MLDKVKKFLFTEDEDYEYAEKNVEEKPAARQKMSKLKINQAEVVISEPLSYSESQSIADFVLSNRTVIINLHRVTPEQAKRIVDFLSGAVYALDGTIEKVREEVFLIAPKEVPVSGSSVEGSSEIDFD